MIKRKQSKINKVLLYAGLLRSFRPTWIWYLYEISQVYSTVLVVEKLDQRTEGCLNNKKIFVLRTFTKFFALPGLRIGYLVASRTNIEKLQSLKLPWSVNMLAQETALRALEDKDYIRETREYVLREKDFLFSELSKIKGLKPYPTRVNFLFLEITKEGLSSAKLQELLLNQGILIRDCSNFRNLNNKFIRVAIRSQKENLCLLKSIQKIFLQ